MFRFGGRGQLPCRALLERHRRRPVQHGFRGEPLVQGSPAFHAGTCTSSPQAVSRSARRCCVGRATPPAPCWAAEFCHGTDSTSRKRWGYCWSTALEPGWRVLERLHEVVPPWRGTHVAGGYPSKMWCRRSVAYYQEDVAALLNPRLFREFLLPLAQQACQAAEVNFIHLHSACLYPVDILLEDGCFDVLEINIDHAGVGPSLPELIKPFRRIQAAKRPLLLWGELSAEDQELIRSTLSPVGLSLQPIVRPHRDSQVMNMNRLCQDISASQVPTGAVRMWWLGQAGFAFKTPAGRIVYADPYLSDAVERLHGFKRLSLPAITAEEVQADLVVLTHEHTDHLDPDALPIIARNNPACRFAAPIGCADGLTQAGITPERRIILEANQASDLGCIIVHTAPADHGDYSPSALALVLDFDSVRVMLSGDTSLRPGLFQPLMNLKPDVILPCINGGFGNMNHMDAARLVQQANPRYAIPCHYWTFAEQGGGDPAGFIHACQAFCPDVNALLLKPGELFTVHARQRSFTLNPSPEKHS